MGNITRKKKINLRRKKNMDSEDQNNRLTITTHRLDAAGNRTGIMAQELQERIASRPFGYDQV